MYVSDYRDILRQEFLKRREENPDYTLSQFSKDCGLPSNRMSDILNKRYGLSRQSGESVAERINLEEQELELFITSIESEHARSKSVRDLAADKLKKIRFKPDRFYSAEELNGFLNWDDLAVVELMRHPEFNQDLKWLSYKLKKTIHEIKATVNKMIGLGTISKINGVYTVNYDYFATSSHMPSNAIKAYHKQILDITKESIDRNTVEERDISSVSFLCDVKNMNEIKSRIKSFMNDLVADFEEVNDDVDLHVLNVQFFSPTENQKVIK